MKAPTPLDYATHERPQAWKRWLVAVLTVYPLFLFIMIHLVWGVEYVVNGTKPDMPHHGADNAIESALYVVTDYSCLGGGFILPMTVCLCLILAVIDVVLTPHSRRALGWFLPILAWVLVIAGLIVDPVDAAYFFLY